MAVSRSGWIPLNDSPPGVRHVLTIGPPTRESEHTIFFSIVARGTAMPGGFIARNREVKSEYISRLLREKA
jgi:hypothetical protein